MPCNDHEPFFVTFPCFLQNTIYLALDIFFVSFTALLLIIHSLYCTIFHLYIINFFVIIVIHFLNFFYKFFKLRPVFFFLSTASFFLQKLILQSFYLTITIVASSKLIDFCNHCIILVEIKNIILRKYQ